MYHNCGTISSDTTYQNILFLVNASHGVSPQNYGVSDGFIWSISARNRVTVNNTIETVHSFHTDHATSDHKS